jgi:hypothetical protein
MVSKARLDSSATLHWRPTEQIDLDQSKGPTNRVPLD